MSTPAKEGYQPPHDQQRLETLTELTKTKYREFERKQERVEDTVEQLEPGIEELAVERRYYQQKLAEIQHDH